MFKTKTSISNCILFFSAIMSVFAVLLIPPYEGSILEWMAIPALSWLRYLSTLLLTSFFPGCFLLKMIDKQRRVAGVTFAVLSYLLSIFLSSFAAFLVLLLGKPIPSLGGLLVIYINVLFLILAILATRYNKTSIFVSTTLTIDFFPFSILLSLLSIIAAGSVFVMLSNMPLTHGDMMQHHGIALDLSEGFPIYGGKMITYPGGYIFHLYLSVIFTLSGIPSAIAEQSLYVLNFMTFLSLYSMLKSWFFKPSENKIVSMTILLSSLLGFGGLYALYLKFMNPFYDISRILSEATQKTYDVYMRVILLPDIVAPVYAVGLPTLFVLLSLLKKDYPRLIKTVIIPSIIALGYLSHIAEILYFIIILSAYMILIKPERKPKFGPYILLGLFLIFLIDFIAPAQVYIYYPVKGEFSITFIFASALTILITLLELMENKLILTHLTDAKKSLTEFFERNLNYFRWILIYGYIFAFMTWLYLRENFNLWEWGGLSFTPFFVFPTRFGLVGLLMVLSISLYFKKIIRNHSLLFFMLLIFVGFTLEQTCNYYQFYPAYRSATITFIGACVISAFGIIELMNNISNKMKRLSFCLILLFLLVFGMLSTALFYVNASYYSRSRKLSQDIIDALNYIRQNTPQNASVLTFTTESANYLRNLAGLNPVQDAQRWSHLLLSTFNPYLISYILANSNVKYVYVTKNDYKLVSSNGILKTFLKYFPKVFESDNVTIYEVSHFSHKALEQTLGVFSYPSHLQENSMWTEDFEDSLNKRWRLYSTFGKIKDHEMKIENGIMKLSVVSNQTGNVWISYSYPLNFKTKNSMLYFRYKVDNDYTWFTVILQNTTHRFFIYAGHLTDKTFTTKTYPLPDDQTITRIELIVETCRDAPPQTVASAQIDYIEISSCPFTQNDVIASLFINCLTSNNSYFYMDDVLLKNMDLYLNQHKYILLTFDPTFQIESLLRWVSKGNNLVVLNTYGNGFFANLLEINSGSLLSVTKNLGFGKILYINLFSLISTGRETEIFQVSFLKDIKETLQLREGSVKSYVLPVYNSSLNGIQFEGDLELRTDFLELRSITGFNELPYFNVTSIRIYGNAILTIKNASLLLYPSESCIKIKPEKYPIEAEIFFENRNNTVIIFNDMSDCREIFPFKIRTINLVACARLPSVNAAGTMIFDQLDVHAALYIPLQGIVKQKSEIRGKIRFSTSYISSPLILFSIFQAEGIILNLSKIPFKSIPWRDILFSSYNIIFNLIFALVILCVNLKKRIKIHTSA